MRLTKRTNWTIRMEQKDSEQIVKKQREFGLIMALALLVFAGIFFWKGKLASCFWATFGAGIFSSLAIISPSILGPVEKIWMKFAEKLSVVMTYVIVTLTFFLVLTPIGLILRLFGKQFLPLGFEPDKSTYWEPADSKGSGSRHFLPY